VELHAYARTEDFDGHLPTFEKIILGAKVAPDLVYRPGGSDEPGSFAGFNLELIGFLAVLAALIAIAVATMRKRRRREG
jgi:hypothetical protein